MHKRIKLKDMGKTRQIRRYLWGTWWRKALFISGLLVALYAVVGFWLIPALAQWQLPKLVSKHTHGVARVKSVAFNPFTFDLRVNGFGIASRQGKPLLGFQHLDINFDLSSLINQAFTFAWIRLDKPYVHAKINPSGQLNLATLLASKRASHPAAHSAPTALPALLVKHLQITDGQVAFTDRSHSRNFHSRLHSIGFSLRDFSTRPKATGPYRFVATAADGQSLAWRGHIGVNPLRSQGKLSIQGLKLAPLWAYVGNRFRVALNHGRLGFNARYSLQQGGKGLNLSIQQGELTLKHLALVQASNGKPLITVPETRIAGMRFSLAHRRLTIDSVTTRGGDIKARLDADHQLNLSRLLKPKSATSPKTARPASQASGTPFDISVGQVHLKDYALGVTDASGKQPVHFQLHPVSLSVKGYSSTSGKPLDISADLGLDGGHFSTRGSVSLQPLGAHLHFRLAHLSIQPFQPYISRYANLRVKSGTVGVSGKVVYKAGSNQPDLTFDGQSRVDHFDADDTIGHKPFARLAHLLVQGIHYSTRPSTLSIQTITVDKPYARVVVEPNHSTNISAVLPGRKKTPPTRAKPTSKQGQSLPISIHRITLKDGTANFADLSLTPHFATGIDALNGSVTGLSTRPDKSADVNLQGKVNQYAPVSIKGTLNPLGKSLAADIGMRFEGIGLTAFSPYSGKFAGYRIKKGKATLILHYKLHHGMMQGANKIVLDQLELGEHVNSPDAIHLPLRLAVALLKNSQGVIHLDLPVHGNFNNPQFAIGPLIGKALLHVLHKAVASPFHFLARLVPGGGALDHVNFPPGQAALGTQQTQKLKHLAQALEKRPELQLNIQGVAAQAQDRHALAEQALLKRLHKKGQGTQLPAKEEDKRLLKLYRQTFKAKPEALVTRGKKETKTHYQARVVQAARQRLTQHLKLPDNALRQLAQARAEAVQQMLVDQGHVNPERIYLIGVNTQAKVQQGEITMPLQLQAR